MGDRYVGLWTKAPDDAAHDRLRANEDPDLALGLAHAHVTVLHQRTARVVYLDNGRSLLIGSAYQKSTEASPSRVLATGDLASRPVSDTTLAETIWGNYVAVLEDADGHLELARAPFGTLPCLYAVGAGIIAFASDVRLLVEAGLYTPRVDWDQVALDLLVPDLRRPATCLADLCELPGGQRLVISGAAVRRDEIWSPWSFVSADRAIGDASRAAVAVRRAVIDATASHATHYPAPVLKLSGGLDSSIVAVSLAASGHGFTPVTMTTRDASGDERAYARAVATACGKTLLEATRSLAGVDVRASASSRLPRPGARSFAQETQRIMSGVAVETGATAIFEGGGGDNVFCNLHSAVAVADALRTCGPGATAWNAMRDTAAITGAGMLPILRRTIHRAWLSDRGYRWPVDPSFLATAVVDRLEDSSHHPWLTPPSRSLPGRATHVALIAAAQSWIEAQDPQDAIPIIAPLLAQPVVETCLRVPTWLWIDGGINRAVARKAFADRLPPEVATRRTKGTPESFLAEVFEANRATIASLLLDGVLLQNGLLDEPSLVSALRDTAPLRGRAFLRILRLVDVETWARAYVVT